MNIWLQILSVILVGFVVIVGIVGNFLLIRGTIRFFIQYRTEIAKAFWSFLDRLR
jgi:hypothetical protein